MTPRRALLALLLACLCACWPAAAQTRVGVVTMQPGQVFWERFGHDAIVVDDPARGEPLAYNFGYFDMGEADFVARFVRGDMRYALVVLPLREDLAHYRQQGRGVSIQWLDLTAEETARLVAALEEHAKPENARYRYDYFLSNCSTKVRDALDAALDGRLRRQLQHGSQGNTHRSEAARLARPAPWMWLGFQLGLGPLADRPLNGWEEGFIPMRLADGLARAVTASGTPLVRERVEVFPHRLPAAPEDGRASFAVFAAIGTAVALAMLWASRRRPSRAAIVALPFWLLCGLIGVALLFVWLGTDHWAAHRNHNLLLFSPFALLLLPGAVCWARGRAPGRLFRIAFWLVALGALAGMVLSWLQLDRQDNAAWIALTLPVHAAAIWRFARRARFSPIMPP